jgi:hypothetical protein
MSNDELQSKRILTSEPQDPIEAYFSHFAGMEFREYHGDGEGFVDAAADQETLAAKLAPFLNSEDS